jgi:hypothetical protein
MVRSRCVTPERPGSDVETQNAGLSLDDQKAPVRHELGAVPPTLSRVAPVMEQPALHVHEVCLSSQAGVVEVHAMPRSRGLVVENPRSLRIAVARRVYVRQSGERLEIG